MIRSAVLCVVLAALPGSTAFAAEKTYQVTGPVLEVRDDAVVVQKGKERWEITRDAQTKVSGELKAGTRATVHYTMKAKSVEVKAEAKKK